MFRAKQVETPLPAHHCPVCHYPQMKLQRRLSPTTNGSTMYVCARVGECSVAVNVTKIETWVAV